MNMYLHELKAYRKSTIIWTLSLIAIVVLFMSLFPAFSRDAEDFMKVLEGFPEEVKKAIGLSFDTLATILGYFSYAFLYIKLCGAIQAMNLGLSIFSKESRDKTAEFLFTKPVTRTQVMTAKLLACFTSLILTNLAFILAVLGTVSMVKTEEYSGKALLMISGSLLFLQLIFLGLGVFLAVLLPKVKSVIAVSLGTVFAFFMIGMISSSTDDEALRFFTPFNYVNDYYIIEHLRFETSFLLVGAVIIILSVLTSFLVYRKKDIHSV
ncbi:ABC transporter permease subunit [Mesobacillus maritimus]|uniref:ABC transporter permease subunit n=1 Tax=Mesobacillus maritimus TaxID=1643336 RepID=A0ABS7K088_9BACI|nr:ABC transporter permease subunit [Mesobacillus maritimus]MBY0095633.1 ABC transporter permease subunit [Mesobacillus maritimus]